MKIDIQPQTVYTPFDLNSEIKFSLWGKKHENVYILTPKQIEALLQDEREASENLLAKASKLLEALQNLTTAANMFLAGCGEEIYNNQFKHIEKAQSAIKEATE